MPDNQERTLEAEATAFGLTLLGSEPGAYVAAQYARAHQYLPLQPVTAFDRALLTRAARGPWALRAADGYARIFAPTSTLRRKLTVLVAILESASPTDAAFAATEETPGSVLVQLMVTGVGFVLLLGGGIIVLAPIHLVSRLKGGNG